MALTPEEETQVRELLAVRTELLDQAANFDTLVNDRIDAYEAAQPNVQPPQPMPSKPPQVPTGQRLRIEQ